MIRWTKTRRGKLHGFRTIHQTDPPGISLSPTEAWATLRRLARDVPVEFSATPAHQASLARVLGDLEGNATPDFEPTVEPYRMAVALRRGQSLDWMSWESQLPARALIGLWASAGPEALIGMLVSGAAPVATKMSLQLTPSSRRVLVTLDDPAPHYAITVSTTVMDGLSVEHDMLWAALRCHAGALDDAAFADLNRAAHAARVASDDDWTRSAIAFALSRDPSHAEAEIARLDSGLASPMSAPWLLVAAPDAATAERLHRAHWPRTILTTLSYDLVESFGVDAAPILRAIEAFAAPHAYSGARHARAALKLVW